MSVIAAVVGPATDERVLRRMLAAGHRDADVVEVAHGDGAAIAVARPAWALEQLAGGVGVLAEGELLVAADATLYYRDELRRRLAEAGVSPAGESPSHLVAAAYRAWGARCAERLEGDFAFVLWDGAARRLVAASDFTGKRPLFHARVGESHAVASLIGAVAGHPGCPSELNVAAIAEDVAGLTGSRVETWCRAVSRLPAGHTLVLERGQPTAAVAPHWQPPPFDDRGAGSLDDGAEELLALLTRAVDEPVVARFTPCR
jgi:asparagine synthase (glutamine-hydrolysing)